MKKTSLFFMALAALCLAACNNNNEDGPEIVIEETATHGEGTLVWITDDGDTETPHTFAWKVEGTTISVDLVADLEWYNENQSGEWQLGTFTLPKASINEFIGGFVTDLDEESFLCYNTTDGAQFEMNSYKPGVWLDANGDEGYCSDFCWQWYIWQGKEDLDGDEISYDLDQDEYPDLFYVVVAPGNFIYDGGKTIKSTNKIVVGDNTFDFIVTCKVSGEAVEAAEDTTDPLTDAQGTATLVTMDNTRTETAHTVAWNISSEGVEFDVTISLAGAGEDWALGYVKIANSLFDAILPAGKTFAELELEDFYPLEADGSIAYNEDSSMVGWKTYAPGQWVTIDGNYANWSDRANHSYWWMSCAESYEGEPLQSICFGQCPGVPAAGDVVVSKASLCGIPWKVTFTYVE